MNREKSAFAESAAGRVRTIVRRAGWMTAVLMAGAMAGAQGVAGTADVDARPAARHGPRTTATAAPASPLARARAFADCMLRYGRDRYGRVASPLFSNSLTRTSEPRQLPYPRFADPDRVAADLPTPFRRFDFNTVLNYPRSLGAEGPHKVTVYGCDPYEDRALYETLYALTRVTGDPRYAAAADEALTWWFRHTQSPQSGLYPWGEHMGWDLAYDAPTYFEGPSRHLYAACYHEVKDTVPFLDVLARLPAATPGGPTPLERYAFGIWNAHFWEKENAWYCRHGDYTGQDRREGSDAGFPAHLAAYLQVWLAALRHAQHAATRNDLADIIRRALDMAVARTEKYGAFPFTFAPELNGAPADTKPCSQALRLARHAARMAGEIRACDPDIAGKLQHLAQLHLGTPGRADAPDTKPAALFDDPGNTTPDRYASAIRRCLDDFTRYGDPEYLDIAHRYARTAIERFLPDDCPLPKYSYVPLATAGGKPFPDFYFRGASLMHAFVLLAEVQRKPE